MTDVYRETFAEALILVLLSGGLIFVPLYLNSYSISHHMLGVWGFEAAVYGMSMQPALQDGYFVVVNVTDPSMIDASVDSGDIIIFDRPNSPSHLYPTLIVHRAINKTVIDGLVYFRTKGDSNSSPDAWEDTRGQEYVSDGMISERLLRGKVVGVRKPYAVERPVEVMAGLLGASIVVGLTGHKFLTRKESKPLGQ